MVLENFGSNINFGGVAQGFSTIVTWVIVLGVIALIAWLLWYIQSFKNTLVVRDVVNQRKIINLYKWKIVKDKNNVSWLVTRFNRIKKQLPPSNSIDITNKAKKWVEAWRGSDNDTFLWASDDFNMESFARENVELFQPLLTTERELLANEIAKSNAYMKKTAWELIAQLAVPIGAIIFVAVIAFTIGDVTQELTEFNERMTQPLSRVAESFVTASENLARIQNVDTITINNTEVPN